jgi:hypothetical protein
VARSLHEGAIRIIPQTTGTGTYYTQSSQPVRLITVQAAGPGTGTFEVDGSLDGTNWTAVIAATTFPTAGRTVSSTSLDLITNVRARFTVTGGSTAGSALFITGA